VVVGQNRYTETEDSPLTSDAEGGILVVDAAVEEHQIEAVRAWRAQRDMQYGTILSDIDLLAAEHRIDALAQAALFGQPQQQFERLVGNAVLRVVEVNTFGLRS